MEDRDLDIGERVKESREYIGLTQQQVAAALSIPRRAVSDIERGKRKVSVEELKGLSLLLKHPIAFFMGEEPELEPEVAALARTAQSLTESDKRELLRFAKFLQYQHQSVSLVDFVATLSRQTSKNNEIKLALFLSGTSEAEIARNLGLTRASISMVVTGKSKSRRVREAIATVLDMAVEDLWPDTSILSKRIRP